MGDPLRGYVKGIMKNNDRCRNPSSGMQPYGWQR